MTPSYTRLPASALLESNDHLLCQNVAEHYTGCVGGHGGLEDGAVPEPVRRVCRLWQALADIGYDGLGDYLLNHAHDLPSLQSLHADLKAVEATELRQLLEAGVRLSMDAGGCELLQTPQAITWAASFKCLPGLTPELLNQRSIACCAAESTQALARYIQQHRACF